MPVNCQISLRVEKKVPQGETSMAHSFPLSVNGQNCHVSYSNPRERAVKAYVVPNDIAKNVNVYLDFTIDKGIFRLAHDNVVVVKNHIL